MKKFLDFVKKEAVLSVAVFLAIISMFIVKPDKQYLEYIDFRTLAILFCLMCVMAGFQALGVFKKIATGLIDRTRTLRSVMIILVLLCFFFAMVITNDVALITFVPFTFTTFNLMEGGKAKNLIAPTIVLETIAANLGSMLTPIGNPQNLYLYSIANMGFADFVLLMLPYTIVSLGLILAFVVFFYRKEVPNTISKEDETVLKETTGSKPVVSQGVFSVTLTELFEKSNNKYHSMLIMYIMLFLVALMTVARALPYPVMFFITLVLVALSDRKVLMKVDYSLLFTFVGFFIFIGNMGRIPSVSEFLRNIVTGNETLVGILSSQVISNVPAALLLSGFTESYADLIVGVNLGGLGTLIASMASLISFKMVAKDSDTKTGHYFKLFTVLNVVFLVVLFVLNILMGVIYR